MSMEEEEVQEHSRLFADPAVLQGPQSSTQHLSSQAPPKARWRWQEQDRHLSSSSAAWV